MDARRKLLKFQRKRGSTEDLMDCLINDTDECPVCDCLVMENFKCVSKGKKIFQCQNCKEFFTPEIDQSNKRRKTE